MILAKKKTIPTRDDALVAADEYRNLEIKLQAIESKRKADMAKAGAKYDEEIAELTSQQNDARVVLCDFADGNRDQLLDGKKKSTTFNGLTIGYKRSTALVTKEGIDWKAVQQRINAAASLRNKYLKRSETVDKTALKKADEVTMEKAGVQLEVSETFYAKL